MTGNPPLGKSGSEASSQLQGRIARAFSSNSLMNTMDMRVPVQYILTAAQLLGSQVYYKKSRMTILGLAGVLFCENEQAQTKWIIICIARQTGQKYFFTNTIYLLHLF